MIALIPDWRNWSMSMSWSFLHIGVMTFRPRSPQTMFMRSHW